ncbi:hypothetical protein [Chloroflexus sp. Y-396-1]|nr:hypothetical protein [Chloroflexus sp. Y-396-1]
MIQRGIRRALVLVVFTNELIPSCTTIAKAICPGARAYGSYPALRG